MQTYDIFTESNKIYTNQAYKNEKGNVYVDTSDVVSGLYRFAVFTRYAVKKVSEEYAKEITEYMRKEAPWKDRTPSERAKRGLYGPNARQSLGAEYFEETNGMNTNNLNVGVKLYHGVSYGVFLEYNGLYHISYLKRRRPILINGDKAALKSKITKNFLYKIKLQFAKITKV